VITSYKANKKTHWSPIRNQPNVEEWNWKNQFKKEKYKDPIQLNLTCQTWIIRPKSLHKKKIKINYETQLIPINSMLNDEIEKKLKKDPSQPEWTHQTLD
jgi:hypothetical protein